MVKRLKKDTATFAEQAKSITDMINNLERSVRTHVRKGHEKYRGDTTLAKHVGQIQRLLDRLGG